ncbi:MAG: family 16 glycosylhydrolase, partial [Pseudomonadota bacterium]
MTSAFDESFDSFDTENPATWVVSDFAIQAGFIDTAWTPDNVIEGPGFVELELDTQNRLGKNFSGAEIKTDAFHHYGRYEVVMRPSGEEGALSAFFVYTGPPFGDPTSEIDFEFIGGDTTQVLLSYHTPEGFVSDFVDLGFDAALAEHAYAFEWGPDSIEWYADGNLLLSVEDPEIGTPDQPGQIHASIWTGANGFTGVPTFTTSTSAIFSEVSFDPRTAPIAMKDDVSTEIGQPIVIAVLANDSAPNGTLIPATLQIDDAPANGSVSLNQTTGEITYTPDPGFQGIETFSYIVSDGTETSNSGNVTVAVGIEVLEEFTLGPGDFVFVDDPFRGTNEPDYASGDTVEGGVRVVLGGGTLKGAVNDISGGWSTSFESGAGQSGTLTVRFRIQLTENLDDGEFGEVLVGIDGVEQSLLRLDAVDALQALDSGFVDMVVDLGALAAGTHTLTLGGYLNQRTRSNEVATIEFDSVDLRLSAPSP